LDGVVTSGTNAVNQASVTGASRWTKRRTTVCLPEQSMKRPRWSVAEDRYARIVATGETIPWQEMRGYLENRLVGKEVERPVARKLAR